MPTLSELRAQPHTSISALKTFLQCPRKYRLQYVDRVSPSFRAMALHFGIAWHETIGRWLLGSTIEAPLSIDELQAHLRQGLESAANTDGPPVLFDDDEQDLEGVVAIGARMLAAFLGAVALPEKVLEVEHPFALELRDPDTGELLPVPLVGAIDAVVVARGKVVLWELKTGKKKWSADQVAFDLQPSAYLRRAAQQWAEPQLKLIVTTKAKSTIVQIEEVERLPQDHADLSATAASVLRAVGAGVDHPIRGWQCRSCAVAGHCR
jgi:hypothetical protein